MAQKRMFEIFDIMNENDDKNKGNYIEVWTKQKIKKPRQDYQGAKCAL